MPDEQDETVDAAADRLYAAPLEDFMAVRGELAKAAKADGDAAAGKAIAALRKPTAAAAVVNRAYLADPSVRERLVELGDRMRRAQQDLDAAALRELTTERRATVGEVTRVAFTHAGRDDPPTALREEVTATFDAAVADPDVAQRLGRLLRSESFSGFGVAAGSPELTLVQGGRGTPARKSTATKSPATKTAKPAGKSDAKTEPPSAPPAPSATARRLARRLDTARTEFETADEQFTAAEAAQQRESDRVRTLTDELAELQRELDDAKRAVDVARREVRTTRTRRREARSALDRAERAVERDGQ